MPEIILNKPSSGRVIFIASAAAINRPRGAAVPLKKNRESLGEHYNDDIIIMREAKALRVVSDRNCQKFLHREAEVSAGMMI